MKDQDNLLPAQVNIEGVKGNIVIRQLNQEVLLQDLKDKDLNCKKAHRCIKCIKYPIGLLNLEVS